MRIHGCCCCNSGGSRLLIHLFQLLGSSICLWQRSRMTGRTDGVGTTTATATGRTRRDGRSSKVVNTTDSGTVTLMSIETYYGEAFHSKIRLVVDIYR